MLNSSLSGLTSANASFASDGLLHAGGYCMASAAVVQIPLYIKSAMGVQILPVHKDSEFRPQRLRRMSKTYSFKPRYSDFVLFSLSLNGLPVLGDVLLFLGVVRTHNMLGFRREHDRQRQCGGLDTEHLLCIQIGGMEVSR